MQNRDMIALIQRGRAKEREDIAAWLSRVLDLEELSMTRDEYERVDHIRVLILTGNYFGAEKASR